MNPEEKQRLRQKIASHILKTQDEIEDIEENTQPISPENSIGRVSRMDAINNKSVMEAALRNKKAKLAKLKMALSGIERADFGICSMCKNPIQQGRLMFMPESTKCIRCAAR